MFGLAEGSEGNVWRPWPCEACGGGITALSYLIGRSIADGTVSKEFGSPEQIAEKQSNSLIDWVSICPHTTWENLSFPKGAEGSEHVVHIDPTSAIVWKVTRPGVFGDTYYLVGGRMHQQNSSPLDYLIRLRLWMRLFLSAPVAMGITRKGQIVSKHEFITGTIPSQEAVDQFLIEAGFTPVRQEFWLWKKNVGRAEIWIGDARDENFVQTPLGIVPIDLRVWQPGPVDTAQSPDR